MHATAFDEKISTFPDTVGNGISYYIPIIDGISVVLFDAVFTHDVVFKRPKSDDDLYILHYDLSEKTNSIEVINPKRSQKATKLESGFTVFHSRIGSTFKPLKNQRTFALSLLIEKEKLLYYLGDEEDNSLKNTEKKILLFNDLNNSSKSLINSLKDKSVGDIDYPLYIKGISLKLLGNFIDTFENSCNSIVADTESTAIKNTINYLSDHLYENFPGIPFLSNLAKMSATKYKVFFKQIYDDSPNHFFTKQKMILANQLLKSGTFSSVNEISKVLNYSKLHSLSNHYFKCLGRKPSNDFKPKTVFN
jgi:AraC-like DNA-binding protein